MAVRERTRQAETRGAFSEAGASPGAAGTRRRRAAPSDAGSFPLLVFVVHWLLVQIPASFAYLWGEQNRPSPPYGEMPPALGGLFGVVVEPLRHWDGLWYALIAEQGYGSGTQIARAAFWPLYPWLMGVGSRLTGLPPEVVGYAVGNVAFAGGLVLLYRLLRLDFADDVARRSLWAIALFPTALFFTAVYTESLFLALSVGALLAARTRRWWLAGAVGALAALTRSQGVFLLLPFAVLIVQQQGWDARRWFPAAIPAAGPLLGPAIFGWHLNEVLGNWRAFVDVQAQWVRYSALPWETLRCGIESCFALNNEPDGATWSWLSGLVAAPSWDLVTSNAWRVDVANSDTLELASTLLFLVLAVIGFRMLPLWQSVYVVPALLIPLLQPSRVHALMSMPRFVLVLFPLFVVLGVLLRGRLGAVAAAVSSVLLVLLSIQFALWYWVS